MKAKAKAKRGRPRKGANPVNSPIKPKPKFVSPPPPERELKPNPPPPNKCATCVHWKNKQALLNYSSFNGFCVNDKFKFNINDDRLVGVIDKQNLRDRSGEKGNPSHDFEVLGKMPFNVHISRYNLQTNEEFGCLFHTAEFPKRGYARFGATFADGDDL